MNTLDNICGAKTRNGTPCKRKPLPNGRCKLHGGKSLSGIQNGNYKHGRYSKVMPAHLLANYQNALTDDKLLELRDEIALVDSHLQQAISDASVGVSVKLVDDIFRELQEAQKADSPKRAGFHLREATRLAQEGHNKFQNYEQIHRLINQRVKLVESERKRLTDLQQNVTVEKFMLFVTFIVDSVKRNVKDREALSNIQADITRVLGSVE